jgi:hypothetical protein
MGRRLIISDNLDDPLNPLVLDGAAFAAAARDPLATGMLMVDQVRVLASPRQVSKERGGMEQAAGRAAGGVPRRALGLSNSRRATYAIDAISAQQTGDNQVRFRAKL